MDADSVAVGRVAVVTLRDDLAALRAVRDMAALAVKLVGRPDDDRDHSMATLTRRDLCLICDAAVTSVDALDRIAAVVNGYDSRTDYALGAFDEIRAILDGAVRP